MVARPVGQKKAIVWAGNDRALTNHTIVHFILYQTLSHHFKIEGSSEGSSMYAQI